MCLAADGDDCCSDDDGCGDDGVESFNDKGKGSVIVVLFRLRSAIFEDGGTGARGIGRMSFELWDVVVLFSTLLLLGPSVRLSSDVAPVIGVPGGSITGARFIGKVDMGNFSRLFIRFFCCCTGGWDIDSS